MYKLVNDYELDVDLINYFRSRWYHMKVSSSVQTYSYRELGRPVKVKALVAQLCPTLSDPMDCSSPGSSVYGILQARILESVAIPFSRG